MQAKFNLIRINLAFLIIAILSSNLLTAQTAELVYSTIIGGGSYDYGHAIFVDKDGCAYIGGQAHSTNFPTTPGVLDRTHNGSADILVTKLNQDGSGLVYSTFIGGSQFDDTRNIFVDNAGCVYLSGGAQSPNFPTTENALQGNSEGYFLKLSADGSTLDYSSNRLGGEKIISDGKGNIIMIAGFNGSNDFQRTENAYRQTPAGGEDVLVVKLNLETNEILFSTLIGGSGNDMAMDLAQDNDGDIIIFGMTDSGDFPVKGKAFVSLTSTGNNVFVAKLKSDGTELLTTTIIGGSDNDRPFGLAVDKEDNIYITGVTTSNDYSVTDNAFQTMYAGSEDGYLTKISADGKKLIYSTYLGGGDKDGGRGVVVDRAGRAAVTGCTRSANFPVTDNAFDKTYNGGGSDTWAWGDPFLLLMNPEGTQPEYATYFGGSADEEAYGIAIDKNDNIYICGVTSSSNFPTTSGAYDKRRNGPLNIYAAKFSFNDPSGAKTSGQFPSECQLLQNYPNPFNPSTTIRYHLSVPSDVSLCIYNMLGQEIKTLVDSYQNIGKYAIGWQADGLPAGIYFAQLRYDSIVETKKLILTL